MKLVWFFVGLFFFIVKLNAQSCEIIPLIEKIEIDGKLTEKHWQENTSSKNFIQNFPYDTSESAAKTEFWLAADNQNLYAAFKCYYINGQKKITVQSLQRDFSVNSNDAVVLTIEPFLDGQNGFSFGVTPQNAQREGAIENAGNFGVSTAWDQVWYSATNIGDSFWTAEFKIPFKSIRYNSTNTYWRLNVSRLDFSNNEKSCWSTVPRNFNISSLAFCKPANWRTSVPEVKSKITLIPYVSTTAFKNVSNNETLKTNPKIGFDVKYNLSSSLSLDLTVNPDFAQVDVDAQQLNLTQFNLFFPERRQFFIENSDLFANFGFRGIRPFFSRRIGLQNGALIPITGGARVTGKIGNKWRIGLMDVVSKEIDSINPAKNFLIAAFQRKAFSAGNIGFILVNENQLGKKGNTVGGLEYNLLSKSNKWVGKAFYQYSLSPVPLKRSFAHASFLLYRTIHWHIAMNHEFSGSGFRAPTGFVPRQRFFDQKNGDIYLREFWRLEPSIGYKVYPKSSWLNNTEFSVYHSSYFDSAFRPTEQVYTFSIINSFQNSANITLTATKNLTNVFVHFNPIKSNGKYLLGNYDWSNFQLQLNSNLRKKLTASATTTVGQFYNGERVSLISSVSYRMQPWGIFGADFQRESIELPELGKQQLDLIGLRAELSFSTTMYLKTWLQYNTQAENTNLYIRYQWRYRPMSDLFFVYSKNYNTTWESKNWSVAFKCVYWLNL